MNTHVYERITERIIALLEQGTVPWHRQWNTKTGLPRNRITQKPYRGINVFLLASVGYESPHWLTYRQAIQLGGSVRKGEKACPVVFWKRLKIEDEESDTIKNIPMLRLYNVFNVAQCDDLKNTEEISMPAGKLADIVANMPQAPVVKHGMAHASYFPTEDYVGLPERNRFKNEAGYYATLFHELVHSTGHEKRLNRAGITERNRFGSDPYCKEELVAELGSAFLCGHADITDPTIDNSAAYIENWLKQLKNDRGLIIYAAAQAQKAADFILGRTFDESEPAHD